jgi:hypothetical protein
MGLMQEINESIIKEIGKNGQKHQSCILQIEWTLDEQRLATQGKFDCHEQLKASLILSW